MIWTFVVKLGGFRAGDTWSATIEIDAESTLEDLHFAIQNAVGFDNDHLYEFFISRTERSADRVRFNDENEDLYNITLESIYPLGKGKKFYYMFDYGDSWLFQITKSRNSPMEPNKSMKYPRMVGESGIKPEQYPAWE